MHCSRLTWSNSATVKKKKKSQNTAQDSAENAESKRALNRKEFNFVNKERRPWAYNDEHKGS